MKKNLKLILAIFVSIFVSTAAFADDFDWSKCWCTYGGGVKEGNVIVDVGVGLPWYIFDFNSNNKNWFVPPVEASLEIPVMIWKLPFSFGGTVYYESHGYSYYRNDWKENYKYYNHSFATGALVKYHVHLPPKNLDVYAGMKFGVGYSATGHSEWNSEKTKPEVRSGNKWFPYHSELIGATWYFAKGFGVNMEFGYPLIVKGGISLKF